MSTEFASDDIAAAVDSSPASSDASSASAPSVSSDAAPATEATSPEVSTSSEPSAAGPIPLDRHKAILERAREEARRQTEAEFRGKLGWAERYQPDTVEQATRLYQWYQQDPEGALTYLQRQMAGSKPPEPPPPDLKAEDGTPVYSAPQMQKLLDYQAKQLQQQIEQTYGPVRMQVEAQRLQQHAYAQAQQTITKARESWPLFSDLEPDIKKAMLDNPDLDLRDAYIQVYATEGRKREQEKWRSEYEGNTQTKAAAATTRPSRPANVQPRKYTEMDIRELVEEEARRLART